MAELIYKLEDALVWAKIQPEGVYRGAPIDLADGFIHFSTATQVRETAAKHFARRAGLVLIGVDACALGAALKWEPSRGGALFPHLYDGLDLRHVRRVALLPLGPDGLHIFPKDFV